VWLGLELLPVIYCLWGYRGVGREPDIKVHASRSKALCWLSEIQRCINRKCRLKHMSVAGILTGAESIERIYDAYGQDAHGLCAVAIKAVRQAISVAGSDQSGVVHDACFLRVGLSPMHA